MYSNTHYLLLHTRSLAVPFCAFLIRDSLPNLTRTALRALLDESSPRPDSMLLEKLANYIAQGTLDTTTLHALCCFAFLFFVIMPAVRKVLEVLKT